MPRPRERARHVLGARGLSHPDRVIAREPGQPPGEERLLREMTAILLSHEHHERRAVHARGGERRDSVAEPGGGVDEDERGLAPRDRPARRHPHDSAFVQAEDEAHVLRQGAQEGDLRRARIGEHRGQAVLAHDLEGRLPNGLGRTCHMN